ncbi:hypothetical protein BG003_007604 [Podila horticola]|nr:hypothetical protein BG003_007604 [Podila horticola]
MALLDNNPQLASLALHLEDDTRYYEIQSALNTTTRLRTLHLTCGKYPNINHLVQFICNNTELQELDIGYVFDFDHFDMTRTPMMHLTKLRLNSFLDTNPGLVDLIRRCPNLEALAFHARFGCPAETIAENIHECCPHLTSIRCLQGTSFRDASWLLCDDKILLLIAATSRLVHFEMEMVEFTSEICDALLFHSQHLETVHIYVDDKDRDTLVHGGKILAACPKLKSFALVSACHAWSPKDGLILLEQPWKSPGVEAFWLDGIMYNGEGEDVDGDYEDFFEPNPDDLEKERESTKRSLV